MTKGKQEVWKNDFNIRDERKEAIDSCPFSYSISIFLFQVPVNSYPIPFMFPISVSSRAL
jgi:hypothetical protein